jgi:hypothetical protein
LREDRLVRAVSGNIPKGRRYPTTQEALGQLLFFKKQAINLTEEREKDEYIYINLTKNTHYQKNAEYCEYFTIFTL